MRNCSVHFFHFHCLWQIHISTWKHAHKHNKNTQYSHIIAQQVHIYKYQTYTAIYKFIQAHTEAHITHINMCNIHVCAYTHKYTHYKKCLHSHTWNFTKYYFSCAQKTKFSENSIILLGLYILSSLCKNTNMHTNSH